MDWFLATLFVIICVLLIVVVLLQRGRGGGLGAAFGGGGGSAFGTRTGDVFTWVTIVLTALFLLLAIGVSFWFRPEASTVAQPTFNPSPGPIDEPVEVTLNVSTRGAAIRYTLDGSTPTLESAEYQREAIRVAPGQTIKARAFRAGWNPSEVAVGYYGEPATQTAPVDEPDADLDGEPELDVPDGARIPATAPATVPATAPAAAPTQPVG